MRGLNGGASASSDPDDAAGRIDAVTSACAAADQPADAQDIQDLLAKLSLLRLAMAAELSAAAGALDAHRSDIASDLVAGARVDLQRVRLTVARQRAHELAPALVPADREDCAAGSPPPAGARRLIPRTRSGYGRWQGRVLAGALAVGLTLLVLPHGGSGSSPRSSASKAERQATQDRNAQQQNIDVRLVSDEFSTLRQTLESNSSGPSNVLAAGQSWHTAVALSLPNASTHATTAAQIVALLREERALLATPAMRAPAMRSAAGELNSNSDSLLARLRAIASTQVLAVLPNVITALPLPTPEPAPVVSPAPSTSTAPEPQVSPSTQPSPASTTPPAAPVSPAPAPTIPPAPTPAPTTPAPTVPGVPSPKPSVSIPKPSLPSSKPSLPSLPGLIQRVSGASVTAQDTTGTAATVSVPPPVPVPVAVAVAAQSAALDQALAALGLG